MLPGQHYCGARGGLHVQPACACNCIPCRRATEAATAEPDTREPSSVQQPWVAELPWKMQSVLASGFRGPDHANEPALRSVARWVRAVCQHNADPSQGYMQHGDLPTLNQFEEAIYYAPVHYAAHLLHALEIVWYRHPALDVSGVAGAYYGKIVEALHLEPEPLTRMTERLKDRPAQVT